MDASRSSTRTIVSLDTAQETTAVTVVCSALAGFFPAGKLKFLGSHGEGDDFKRQADPPDVREDALVIQPDHRVPDYIPANPGAGHQAERVRDVGEVFLQEEEETDRSQINGSFVKAARGSRSAAPPAVFLRR